MRRLILLWQSTQCPRPKWSMGTRLDRPLALSCWSAAFNITSVSTFLYFWAFLNCFYTIDITSISCTFPCTWIIRFHTSHWTDVVIYRIWITCWLLTLSLLLATWCVWNSVTCLCLCAERSTWLTPRQQQPVTSQYDDITPWKSCRQMSKSADWCYRKQSAVQNYWQCTICDMHYFIGLWLIMILDVRRHDTSG